MLSFRIEERAWYNTAGGGMTLAGGGISFYRYYTIIKSLFCFYFRFSGSIAKGLIISRENFLKLVEGHNQYWFNMKRQIKNHLLCSGELSQLHFDGLKVNIDAS